MPIPTRDPIVTIPVSTPIDSQDRVDHDALSRNVERWLKTPATGFCVGTATGEEWFLSEDEKLEIARTVKGGLDEKRFLMGGIDCPGVTETLRKAEAFAAAGAEMLRVRIPRYREIVVDYFDQVLPRSPLPVMVMHQSNPERFGSVGEPAASAEIIGEIVNRDQVFGYTSDHDVRFEANVRQHVAEDKRFWICNGSLILHGTLIGCNGTTTAFANVWPAALYEMLEMGMSGRHDEARPLQEKVQRIDAVMLSCGPWGVKAAMNLLGYEGTKPRAPMREPPKETIAALEQELRNAELIS